MLVLSRKVGETVHVGDGIAVMVLSIHRDKVRLGFTVPRDIRVDRDEVRERIEREKTRELPGPMRGEWRSANE